MFSARRLLAIILPIAFVVSTQTARAAENWSWNGVWKGKLGNSSTISVTIQHDEVTNCLFRGAPVAIDYSKLSPQSVSFGDRDHYNMTLKKAGDASALAVYHGRSGFIKTALAKQ